MTAGTAAALAPYDTHRALRYLPGMERGLYEQIADEELEAVLAALVGRYQAPEP